MGHLTPLPRGSRRVVWSAGIGLVAVAAGEWLRAPALAPVLAAMIGVLATLLFHPGAEEPPTARIAVWTGVVLVLVVGLTEFRRIRLLRAWPAHHAALVQRGTDRTVRELDALARRLDRLADAGAALDTRFPERALAQAARIVPRGGTEVGLAVLDSEGTPVAWAGTHRLGIPSAGPPLALRRDAFYAVLEVRRHREDGTVVVASGLVASDPAVPPGSASVFDRVLGATGVAASLEDSARAGREPLVWPASQPLVAIHVDPPTREDALAALWSRSAAAAGWLVVVLIVAATLGAPARGAGYLFLALLPWFAIRVPLDEAIGLSSLFSPAAFFSPVLGPVSGSAGALAATGLLAFGLAVGLWHARLPWPPFRIVVGVAALLAGPYIVREFGRGITPPAAGVPDLLWLTWHLAVLVPTAALLIIAAALLRRQAGRQHTPWAAWSGAALGLIAGIVGVLVFTGRPGWPAWYTAVWLPAIVLVTRPAPVWATVTCIGLVAGTGGSLITWGASMAGRTDVALRDIARLGPEPDALAEPLLLELASTARGGLPPATAGDLYRLWRASALREQGYPIRLALATTGGVETGIVLDDLGLTDTAFASLATAVEPWHQPEVRRLSVLPGIHHALTAPLGNGRTLVAVTGPRSVLIPPAPLGKILETGPERTTLYQLALVPTPPDPAHPPSRGWRREGWALRTTRPIAWEGTTWDAHATIPLGHPSSLFVRGGLVVLLDVALLAVLWLAAERVAGIRRRLPRLRHQARSYQARVALALSVFFAAPAALLAGFSTRQLAGEAVQSRDLVLERILRDARSLDGFPGDSAAAAAELARLARLVDADLALYIGGRRAAVSEPLLADLGVFPGLLSPAAHHAIHLDGDRYAGQPGGAGAIRTGHAATEVADRIEGGVLATVAASPERAVRERQRDVVFTLLLVTLLGVLAAVGAARRAARALSRPVALLRDAALEFGRTGEVSRPPAPQPLEFEPVFEAFGRMATDIRTSQAALEAARSRTEAVLATVSTGVIALDPGGRVLLANARAEEAVGVPLPPGRPFAQGLTGPWRGLLPKVAGGEASTEVDARGRRYEVRFAPLPPEVGGLVLAINDVTESTRAARVLAWADVANQVAHAIKNPLTPLRLGIQHLQRVREQRPARFDEALSETSARILAEIERLDAIARAFARLAAPAGAARPLEPVDCAAVAAEVAALYGMAPEVAVSLDIPEGAIVAAQREELTEVLLNLCDNARNAGARRIVIRLADGILEVEDDGDGIAPEHLARVFEPRFSTRSRGSGLGLAIVRRMVESWGATVTVRSAPGQGTTFRIGFPVP